MAASGDELLRRAVEGDTNAISALLKEYGPQVRRGVAGKIPGAFRSVLSEDDVMQVTYLEAYLGLEKRRFQAEEVSAFIGWLRQIADDNLKDALKELQRAKRPPPKRRITPKAGQESIVALVDLLGYTSTTPSRDAARGEMCEFMEKALRKLPPDHAKVIRLYDLENRPPEDVAAALGRSEGAMYMLRARAHERLKDHLGSSSKYFTRTA